MLNSLIELIGYESLSDLPYFTEEYIIVFLLVLIFFGALAFFNALLKIIFGLFPGKD